MALKKKFLQYNILHVENGQMVSMMWKKFLVVDERQSIKARKKSINPLSSF